MWRFQVRHFRMDLLLRSSIFVLLLVNIASSIQAYNNSKILNIILDEAKYDSNIRPWRSPNETEGNNPNSSPPTPVNINVFIRSISEIDDYEMEYSVQVTFRMKWYDFRLKYDNIQGDLQYLTLTDPSRIWTPNLFFSNEKEAHFHKIMLPNLYVRIFPNGEVLYSSRISLTLSCPMNLKLFPMDEQICSINIASYSLTNDEVLFAWTKWDPVQMTRNIVLPRFSLHEFSSNYRDAKTSTGEYRVLHIDFLFKREFSYYLLQFYIPSIMLVMVSWVSFWLDQSMLNARILLGVITLLAMGYQTSYISSSLPPVSYVKAIDIWTGVSLTFIFASLLVSATIHYLSRNLNCQGRPHEHSEQPKNPEEVPVIDICQCETLRHQTSAGRRWMLMIMNNHPKSIDVRSRIFFPVSFLIFIFCYFFIIHFLKDHAPLSGRISNY